MALLAVLKREDLIDLDYLRDVQRRIHDGIQEHGIPDCLGSAAQELVGEEDFDDAVANALASLRDGGASYMDYWEPTREDLSQMGPSDLFRGLGEFLEMLDGYGDEDEYAEANQVMQDAIADRISKIEAEQEEEDWRHQEEEHYWRSRNPTPPARSSQTSTVFRPPLSSLFEDRPASPAQHIFSDIDE